MIPYIIVFFISTVLAYISEQSFNKQKKKKGILILVLAILPLAILAGLRTTDLGYDTKLYGIGAFNMADSCDFSQYKNYMSNSSLESGFLMIVFILDKIYGNINFVLFGLQLIVSIAFIIFAYNYREKCSITLMMFIYDCTLYLFTYNILRQSIALALCFIMVILFDKKKYISAIITFIISIFFHNSAIFSIFAPIIMLINDSKKMSYKLKTLIYLACVAIVVLLLLYYSNVIDVLYNVGIIGSKYTNYFDSSNYREIIDIEYSLLIMKSLTIILGFIYFSSKDISKETKSEDTKWFIMLIIDYFITFLSFKLANTDRVSWYLYYPALFILTPKLIKCFKNDKINSFLGYCIIGGIFFLYFLEKMITNQYQICPYVSIFG